MRTRKLTQPRLKPLRGAEAQARRRCLRRGGKRTSEPLSLNTSELAKIKEESRLIPRPITS